MNKKENVLAVIFLAFLYFPSTLCEIQCYKCSFTRPPFITNETLRLCKDFDYSDKFIVTCSQSTFCVKKSFSAKIPNPINGTERDCANQSTETLELVNHKWVTKMEISEPYTEGCVQVDDHQGLRSGVTRECYCKGDLCNAAIEIGSTFQMLALPAVIITWSTFLVNFL